MPRLIFVVVIIIAVVSACGTTPVKPTPNTSTTEHTTDPPSSDPKNLTGTKSVPDGAIVERPTPALLPNAKNVDAFTGATAARIKRPERIVVREKKKVDPVRPDSNDALRPRLTRFSMRPDVMARKAYQFSPSESDNAWVEEVRAANPAATSVIDVFISLPIADSLLARSEQKYGSLVSVEAYDFDQPTFLGVFEHVRKANNPISVFRTNHAYTIVRFDAAGAVQWAWRVDAMFPETFQLDDAKLSKDGMLYFNVNYRSYAKEVKSKTAYLYALDPTEGRVLWKSEALISRNEFMIDDDVILTGYGFTAEKRNTFLIDRNTGGRIHKQSIPSGHRTIRRIGDAFFLHCYNYDITLAVKR